MINKVMGSVIPKVAHRAANASTAKGGRLTKFLQSEGLGKVLDMAADNPVICQSAFSLALCCFARPATNYVVTKDKQDATYASCHSISSGVIGFAWPLVFATPLAAGVKRVLKNPQKYLKPGMIKKFYPNVGTENVLDNAGKKIGEKIKLNKAGKMLRKDGSELLQDLEPKMVYGKTEKAAFETANPGYYVDNGGVVRSRTVFKTKNGEFELDKNGNKIGCSVQKDLTPITEEMEIGVKKEQNIKNVLNMIPDIMLAPPRAALTIALIPPIMKNIFGMQKPQKPADNANAPKANLDVTSKANNTVATTQTSGVKPQVPANAPKKGGV